MNIFTYLSRSYDQIVEDLLNAAPVQLPEITDYENDILIRSFYIWAGIAEQLHYYIDNTARESIPSTVRIFENAVKLARSVDIRVRSSFPYQVDLVFTSDINAPSDITIPKDTIVSNQENSIQYVTTQEGIIPTGQTQVTIPANQMTKVENEEIGLTSGDANQVFLLENNIADFQIILTIDAEEYTPQETFYYSLPDDTHFVPTINVDGNLDVIMGDGINGVIPVTNNQVFATYYTTLGSQGGVNENELINIVSAIPLPPGVTLTVDNTFEATGGSDKETTEQLKKRIQYWNRTVETAINLEGYKSLAELAPGVEKAGASYNGGVTVDIFIIPLGGGVASSALLTSVEQFMQDKIIIATTVNVLPAGEVEVLLEIDVEVDNNAVKANVETEIKANLVEFGSLGNQDITGKIVSGNISQIVCNTNGVISCIIKVFSIIPYARPTNTEKKLDWDVELLEGSNTTNIWTITFTSNVDFQLFKNDIFVGNFTVGASVTLPEVEFTINSNQVGGDDWEFRTYKYLGNENGAYQLEEPSILAIDANNIELNLNGGI